MTGPEYERSPHANDPSSQPYTAPTAAYDRPRREEVDAGRLWGTGLATATVAALVAFLGVLIARGIFGIELLAPEREGVIGDTTTGVYVLMAGLGSLVATLILQILAALIPRPLSFFSWIVGLVTLVFAVVPFTTGASPASQFATGLINLCVGLTILTLLPRGAYAAMRPGRPRA